MKSLWSEREKRLLYDNEYPVTKNPAELRYTIRQKIRQYIGELKDALIHPEIRDKRVIPSVLELAEETLRANGFSAEADKVRRIKTDISIRLVVEGYV